MDNKPQIYHRKTSVCWPMKFGGVSARWPFGEIAIAEDHINIKAFFFGKEYKLSKTDISSIEFTNTLFSSLFFSTTLNRNKYCKIFPKDKKFPKWLAFLSVDEDVKRLREFKYIK